MAESRDQQVAELCRSAFEAEHQARYQDAFQIHNNAIAALQQLSDDAKFLDRERKRVARKQVKFHVGRIQTLQPIINEQLPSLQVVLPTSLSAQDSLMVMNNGQPALSMDEIMRSQALKAGVTNTDHNTTLLLSRQAPPYTPSLDPSLPPTAYHIYDGSERQTLYVLQALKQHRYQIPSTALSRTAEFTTPCVITHVSPVPYRSTGFHGFIGREMKHYTASPFPVSDKPDRTKHVEWEPRRFDWGGRRFVWKQRKGAIGLEELREVKREWPLPGSKTGKMEDECFEETLVWGDGKIGLKKCAVIHFKGGMDQVFMELCLASILTRNAILCHGHDD